MVFLNLGEDKGKKNLFLFTFWHLDYANTIIEVLRKMFYN